MSDNFGFLEQPFPSLANLGRLAEAYRETDPNSSIYKTGQLGESIVNLMLKFDKISTPERSDANQRINLLDREGLIPKDVREILHLIRIARNKAVHAGWGDSETACQLLPVVHSLAGWFAQTYGPLDLEIPKYSEVTTQFATKELEENSSVLQTADETQAETASPITKSNRVNRAQLAAENRQKTEAETRLLIDAQMRQVGWEADTNVLRFSNGTRPQKGRNMAIAEWPTDSNVGKHGRADYALFIDENLVGVVEAKAHHVDIPSVLDYQAKDYARFIKADHAKYVLDEWDEFKVPFLFATNGRSYLDQIKTKSGVWFQDVRDPLNVPRALQGWPSPEGLSAWLKKAPNEGTSSLDELSYDVLTDSQGLNCRDYQVAAIQAAEEGIQAGKTEILLAMATGTGKTRTVLGMIYRFLKAKRFRRILFLVDRTSLGDQAMDTFKDVKLEELLTLDELYDIKGLEDSTVESETKVHVSTVQGMVRRVFYPNGDTKPAVTDYDLIIVDEAHRGYLLDKEMSDDELLYRNQSDYQSAYRSLIDYFDAVKIALTATPALHTTEIFGQPVYTYSYREAVMDGWLIDHDAPHQLKTKLSTEGITFSKGDTLPLYDAQSGEITNSAELADEVSFKLEQFNRKVITESFNRTVLEEIARDLDPSSPELFGKTLIYAVDDAHADMIVSILKEIFAERGVDPAATMKITGSVAGGNKKKIAEAIRAFKNESFPSIVVTVDLLTTGIDVEEITTLVFLRRVKSRILFEQMLGRATRLCPEIGKTKFEIYDPVGVYEALEKVSTMKPVSANPKSTFADLLEGLSIASTEETTKGLIDQIVVKLQRRKQNLNAKVAEQIVDLAEGNSLADLTEKLRKTNPADAAAWVQDHAELFSFLDSVRSGEPKKLVISDEQDELISHTRDFGNAGDPKDYLEEFSRFVKENSNQLAALKIICTAPAELTRDQLKSLRLTLDREGFTEQKLSSALSQLSNAEITADIISLVRRYAIGSTLLTHEERVAKAIGKLKAEHTFSKMELSWLSQIEKYLANELLIRTDTFDTDPRFRQKGGFRRIDMAFGGKLSMVIEELNQHMYEDQETSA
ncbi:type I restriction-modification system endonuclease [Staphylococcus chromogenes]|nr:type I restriction-modification system endonuclease [Staphylococcus chromogenes]